jgi:SAM-dependent methyltransferase
LLWLDSVLDSAEHGQDTEMSQRRSGVALLGLWKSHEVSTTTWPERHKETFAEFGSYLAKLNAPALTVLEVGPGAVTKLLKDRLPPGVGRDLPWFDNRCRAILRNVDGLLRRMTCLPLWSYEPGELVEALPPGSRLIVTDISERVVNAIKEQYGDVDARVFDFAAGSFSPPVDAVVCLCVLVRAKHPVRVFANLYQSLKPGGTLVMDQRSRRSFGSSEMPLEEITAQIWRKPD